jgi:hypothetical protein
LYDLPVSHITVNIAKKRRSSGQNSSRCARFHPSGLCAVAALLPRPAPARRTAGQEIKWAEMAFDEQRASAREEEEATTLRKRNRPVAANGRRAEEACTTATRNIN